MQQKFKFEWLIGIFAFLIALSIAQGQTIINSTNNVIDIKAIFNQTELQLGSATISNARVFYSPNGYFIIVLKSSDGFINVYTYFLENQTIRREMIFNFSEASIFDAIVYYPYSMGEKIQDTIVIVTSDKKYIYAFGRAINGTWVRPINPFGGGGTTTYAVLYKQNGYFSINSTYFLHIYTSGYVEPHNNWYFRGWTINLTSGVASYPDYYGITFSTSLYYYQLVSRITSIGNYFFILLSSSNSPYPVYINQYTYSSSSSIATITILSGSSGSNSPRALYSIPFYPQYTSPALLVSFVDNYLNVTLWYSNTFQSTGFSTTYYSGAYNISSFSDLNGTAGFIYRGSDGSYYLFVYNYYLKTYKVKKIEVDDILPIDNHYVNAYIHNQPYLILQYKTYGVANSTHLTLSYRLFDLLTILQYTEEDYKTLLVGLPDFINIYSCKVIGNNPFIYSTKKQSCLFTQIVPFNSSFTTSDIFISDLQSNTYRNYVLSSSSASVISFILKNSPKSCDNYILRFERLYDVYKYVKDSFFDYNCIAIVYLQPYQIYRLYIIDKNTNQVVYQTSGFKVIQSSFTIDLGTQPATQVIVANYLNNFNQRISYGCGLNSNTITCYANNLNTLPINVSFKVERKLLVGYYTLCEDNQKASSLTFNCPLDNNTKEAFVSLVWNVEDYNTTKVLYADYIQNQISISIDYSGIAVATIFFLGMTALGIFNPFVSIILGIVALIVSAKLGLIYLSISSIIGLVLVLIIVKIKEENV
jgi:hypothetical protein